jgi:hypothetical protein
MDKQRSHCKSCQNLPPQERFNDCLLLQLLSFTHTMMILLCPQIPLRFGKKPPDTAATAAGSWQVTATGKLWLLCEEIEQILLTHRITVPQ